MNKIAALYDVTGIQDYIFSSVKLKENIGASIAVQKVLDIFLKDAIKSACPNAAMDWEEYPEIKIRDQDLDAEVIYSGGGNALVIFKNEDLYKKVNRRLSVRILEETGGDIKVASSFIDTIDTGLSDFKPDRQKLVRQLAENKFKIIHSSPLKGIAVTREGETDGLPAQVCKIYGQNQHEYLSFPADQKRKFEDNESFERIPLPGYMKYPDEFDDLGQKEGENHIAVVHIDGNNMGKNLKEIGSYEEMKEFSRETSKAYQTTMQSIIEKLVDALKDGDFFAKLNLKKASDGKYLLPLRVIVLNGDDVTFVSDGRIGIPLAEAFLNGIGSQSIPVGERKIPLSACAGIAIVKSHFPFYRAYQLAEELCSSAKRKGKILAYRANRANGVGSEIGNWLDFHIAFSGVTTDISRLRERLYNVPGLKPIEPLEFKEPGAGSGMESNQYNLLWRPWCIAGPCDSQYCWKDFREKILTPFQDTHKWPRSRLKKLRNESIKSKADIDVLLEEMKSRGMPLPDFAESCDYFRENNNKSPYFDALELLDFYIPLEHLSDMGGE